MFIQPWYDFLHNWQNRRQYDYIPWRWPWPKCPLASPMVQYLKFTLDKSDKSNNNFHYTISCTDGRVAMICFTFLSSRVGEAVCRPRTYLLPARQALNLASVGYLFQITEESLVNHLVGQIASRESGWMVSSPSCPCFQFVRLCVQSMKFMYVAFTSHIYTTFHHTNNTMAYNIQQNITNQAGTEFMGGTVGICPPQLLDRGEVISFVPPNLL